MSYRLSLGTKDTTVYFFKQLVDRAKYGSESSQEAQPVVAIEFDRQLYDDALSLPEAKSVGLKRTDSSALYKYGKFKGGDTYSDYIGTLNPSSTISSEGWVEVVPSTDKYFLYQSGSTYTIIACKDFTPEPIVEDFMPLYEKLKSQEYFLKDTETAGAVNATFSEDSSNSLQSTDEDENPEDSDEADWADALELYNNTVNKNPRVKVKKYDKRTSDLYSSVVDSKAKRHNSKYYYHSPGQVGVVNNDDAHVKNSSVWNDVQAIIYDMKDETTDISGASNILYCFQQPESISYTAQASFESQPTRGSQQPFQFYANANAIELSFVLKWHNDEVKTLSVDGRSLSIQEIADTAEDFTRPWEFENSLKPKLVKVILPGISEIGYMTQAQITYNGDMTGDFTTGSGIGDSATQWANGAGASGLQHQFTTNYYYNQIEITFSLIVVKDIKLLPIDSSSHKKFEIVAGSDYTFEGTTEDVEETENEDEKATWQEWPTPNDDEVKENAANFYANRVIS